MKKEKKNLLHPQKKDNPRLLSKRLSDGRLSLYLEYYLGYTKTDTDILDEKTGKNKFKIKHKRQKEYLGKYLFSDPRKPEEKTHNENTLKFAFKVRQDRGDELNSKKQNMPIENKAKLNFMIFCKKFLNEYDNRDKRIVRYCIEKLTNFLNEKYGTDYILPVDITEKFAKSFKAYLESKLNGETPYNYFTKFKKICKEAFADGYPIDIKVLQIQNNRTEGLKKEILDAEDIQKLANAYCGNDNVKRAFLFSLNTGLRWIDVKALKWSNIGKTQLKITQEKLKHNSKNAILTLDLNSNVFKLIGQRGKPDELVFTLPSHTGCLKSLDNWVKQAKIEKHITWHCSRHSFAVLLLDSDGAGADVKTVSSLLGHSGISHTNKYLHVIDKRKKEAINKLPEINF